jgi:hypothetical protein
MPRTKITEADKEQLIRFGKELEKRMESAHVGFTEISRRTGDKVKVSYISDIVRAARGDSQKFFRIGREKVIQIAAALQWDEAEALRLAGLHPQPESQTSSSTVEEALKNAFFFHAKGLSQKDIETIRPFLEGVDRAIEIVKDDE